MKPLILYGRLSPWTGYGRVIEQLGKAIERIGIPVKFYAPVVDDYFQPLDQWTKDRITRSEPSEALAVVGPFEQIHHGTRHARLTMWETTGLPLRSIPAMQQSAVVIVPSAFCATVFAANGVQPEIAVAPLGIDPEEHREWSPLEALPFTFGTAGRITHGGPRKGHMDVVAAFRDAFPDQDDVRLEVKVWCDETLGQSPDPRITYNRKEYTREQLIGWYRSLSCYVTASRGEGWGLQAHEAMAQARPVITMPWSGVTDYWTPECGYAVDYRLAKADGPVYRDWGQWAVPEPGSLAAAMRRAYDERATLKDKGYLARDRALEFTWHRAAQTTLRILERYGFV